MSDMLKYEEGIFPLYVLPHNEKVPDDIIKIDGGTSFVLQGTTLFQLKNNNLHSVMIAVDDSEKSFKDMFGDTKYADDKIYLLREDWDKFKFPVKTFQYVMKYFQAIYDKHGSEAAVLLMLNQATAEWRVLFVIQVSAAGGSVVYAQPVIDPESVDNFNDKKIIRSIMEDNVASEYQKNIYNLYNEWYNEGFRIFGTIHSHCNFGAFHSSTDDHDELSFDGLHITIGNVRSGWSYSCRYMISKGAFPIDIKDVLGLEDLAPMQNEVNDLEVEDDHMNLMMPNLLKNYTFAVSGNNNNIDDHWWKGNHSGGRDNYYQGYNHSNYGNYNNNYNSSWSDVIAERYVYRIYNWAKDEVLLMKVSYWNANKHRFKTHVIIPDGEIPDDIRQKYLDHNKETYLPKEEVEISERSENGGNVVDFDNKEINLKVITNPLINPNPLKSSDPLVKKASRWGLGKAKNLLRKGK